MALPEPVPQAVAGALRLARVDAVAALPVGEAEWETLRTDEALPQMEAEGEPLAEGAPLALPLIGGDRVAEAQDEGDAAPELEAEGGAL